MAKELQVDVRYFGVKLHSVFIKLERKTRRNYYCLLIWTKINEAPKLYNIRYDFRLRGVQAYEYYSVEQGEVVNHRHGELQTIHNILTSGVFFWFR
jgi:hypothetical protein